MEEGVLEKIIVVERFLDMAPFCLGNDGLVIEYPSSIWHWCMLTESFHIESEPFLKWRALPSCPFMSPNNGPICSKRLGFSSKWWEDVPDTGNLTVDRILWAQLVWPFAFPSMTTAKAFHKEAPHVTNSKICMGSPPLCLCSCQSSHPTLVLLPTLLSHKTQLYSVSKLLMSTHTHTQCSSLAIERWTKQTCSQPSVNL